MRPVLSGLFAAIVAAGSLWSITAPASQTPPGPPPGPPQGSPWQSQLLSEHPLAGRIWQPAAETFVSSDALLERLDGADFLLLGETHDNPDHHLIQAWLIETLGRNRAPAVVFEMINQDQAEALDSYLSKEEPTAEGLGAALRWDDSGWPDWAIYQPVAEAALALEAKIAPGSLAPAQIREVGRNGLENALEAPERARLALDRSWPEDLTAALYEELQVAHCNLLPREAMPRMAEVQRLRDAQLAEALVRVGEAGHSPSILIAGTGHTGATRAVPWYLQAREVTGRVASVALIEVVPGAEEAGDYLDRGDHDFLWFTPRAEREDPCEGLAERLGKDSLSE